MGEFFKGWRRKVGVVTLVMALVVMAGWLRSEVEFDEYNYYSDSCMHKLFSTSGRLGVFRYIAQTKNDFTYAFSVNPDDVSVGVSIGETSSQITQRLEIIGFHFQTGQVSNEIRYAIYTIPYWSIVIPLTLISICLFLSKPRQSTRKKSALPIQEEGGGAAS